MGGFLMNWHSDIQFYVDRVIFLCVFSFLWRTWHCIMLCHCIRGFAKKKIPKIRNYYGSGLNFFCFGKSSQNSPKWILIFWSSIPCVFCLYFAILLVIMIWVFCPSQRWVSKKKFEWGWVERYPSFFWIFGIFLTLQSPLGRPCHISLFFLAVEDLTLCNVVPLHKALCKEIFSPKIRHYYGSGRVGPGLTRNFVFVLENRPKIVLNQYWYCVFCLYTGIHC